MADLKGRTARENTLDERKRAILSAVIEDYVHTAVPVGSRTISRKNGMTLSSATIRNEMSDLEEMGYLVQPHVSAGRVPTMKAYRLYVDTLLDSPVSDWNGEKVRSYFLSRVRQMLSVSRPP